MLVFRYDKSFEGLLTAVFDAYARKSFPERLISLQDPEPMFTTEVHTVITETAKSERVWRGIRKKLPRKVANTLMHVWLSEEEGCDELLFRYIRRIFDTTEVIAYNFTDPDVLRIMKIAKSVSLESHHVSQFLRFQKASDDTWFAPIAPKFNSLPLSINYFRNRFADQKWLIYDTRRKYGYYYDLKTVTEVTMDGDMKFSEDGMLDTDIMAADEKLFQDLWRGYFKALTIRERINPKLHRQNLPARFWKYLTEKQ